MPLYLLRAKTCFMKYATQNTKQRGWIFNDNGN